MQRLLGVRQLPVEQQQMLSALQSVAQSAGSMSDAIGDLSQTADPEATSEPAEAAAGGEERAPGGDVGGQRGEQRREHQVVGQSGGQRGFSGELPGAGVEGGRHGQHDVLRGDRGVGKGLCPSRNEMLQVVPRGRDRRDLGHLGRGIPRQDRLAGGAGERAGGRVWCEAVSPPLRAEPLAVAQVEKWLVRSLLLRSCANRSSPPACATADSNRTAEGRYRSP